MSRVERREIEMGQHFQAWQDDEIKGCAVCSLERGDSVGGWVCVLTINSIYVNLDSRGNGVGSELLGEMKEFAKERGACKWGGVFDPEVWSVDDEEKARNFYKKHGIKIDSNGKLGGRIK